MCLPYKLSNTFSLAKFKEKKKYYAENADL